MIYWLEKPILIILIIPLAENGLVTSEIIPNARKISANPTIILIFYVTGKEPI